jgi:hypothetical protein
MRLESARSLKQELLQNVVLPFTAAASPKASARVAAAVPETARVLAAATSLAVGARAVTSVPEVQRSVAIGVARKGRAYHLAIRVQRQGLMGSPLVEHLVKQAKGEADVRLIGRVDKRPARKRGRRRAGAAAVAVAQAAGPWYRGNVRPLLIGASVGHFAITAGTIGAFVRRGGRTMILSNNHVLANEGDASRGDDVVQRGVFDGGRDPRDRVATLFTWVRFRLRASNLVDIALASIDDGIQHDAGLLRGLVGGADRQLAGVGPSFLDEGTIVHKVGRTTGATTGRVTAFDLDNVVVKYDVGNIRFDGQVEIEGTGNRPFSDGGDSGSLIVDDDMQAVALLFAGGDTGGSNGLGLTYANSIHEVLRRARARLLF